ncbi:MAG: M20 family metallo-hydrolase [Dysgonamonadaceae bacterium]|jgi:acetylornithine deacetylase|nr:M20 family metallo-hydrolase [Dysgonamonadaceae bacterium]
MDTDALFYDGVDLLKQLIAIPSFSREEKVAADCLECYLKDRGLNPARQGNNIWITSPDWNDKKLTVLLNSHIDTVKPSNDWIRNPFLPEESDGKLFGLGSNDAGASLVSLLHSFLLLTARPQPVNFIFLASAEEEISGKDGIESVLPALGKIDFAIVGEPTAMQSAVAEKGLMVLDAVIRGQSGHAARNEGDNAIYRALPVIEWFRTKRFQKTGPLSGEVKMTVTVIEAGKQHNVVPSECRFTVDVRTNECYTNESLFAEIAAKCRCEIKARSFRLNSSSIPSIHPVVKRAIILGSKPFASPTLSDMALMPFPSLKIGPGDSARSHTADEFVFFSEIREAMTIYFKLLDNFCY